MALTKMLIINTSCSVMSVSHPTDAVPSLKAPKTEELSKQMGSWLSHVLLKITHPPFSPFSEKLSLSLQKKKHPKTRKTLSNLDLIWFLFDFWRWKWRTCCGSWRNPSQSDSLSCTRWIPVRILRSIANLMQLWRIWCHRRRRRLCRGSDYRGASAAAVGVLRWGFLLSYFSWFWRDPTSNARVKEFSSRFFWVWLLGDVKLGGFQFLFP